MSTFAEVYEETKYLQLSEEFQLKYLWDKAKSVKDLPGEAAECGCYRGGSAIIIYSAFEGMKQLHLFDTFNGLPPHNPGDCPLPGGTFSCSEQEVAHNLIFCPTVKFHSGLVPGTLQEVKDLKFCFVYLDMDLYQPTLEALRFFYPRMTIGGIIFLDDYPGFNSIVRAVDEFCQETGVKYESLPPFNVMITREA